MTAKSFKIHEKATLMHGFYTLHVLETTSSTNEDAKQAALEGAPTGLVIQALSQSGGKGRQGRHWHSPEGNLYASILLRPSCATQDAGFYSFLTALAVYETVRHFLPLAKIELKWPNDVLVEDKKISGILLEAGPLKNDQFEYLIVGVGLNITSHPENPLYPVTNLCAEGAKNPPVSTALEIFLEKFEKWRLTLLSDGFDSLRSAWLSHARQGKMVARLPHKEIHGTFVSIDEAGQLLLKRDDDSVIVPISAADIFFDKE